MEASFGMAGLGVRAPKLSSQVLVCLLALKAQLLLMAGTSLQPAEMLAIRHTYRERRYSRRVPSWLST